MASILTQDPSSTEAQSPLIAGLTEGLNKISSILNMGVGQLIDVQLTSVPISDTDKNRIYQANMGNRLWLSDPAPVFKKNGVEITQEVDGFEVDFVGGSISFSDLNRLQDSDVVTVTCSYIINTSKTITDITNALSGVTEIATKYKGVYATEADLNSNQPTPANGDYAIVLSSPALYAAKDGVWKNTQSIEDLSKYYTKEEVDNIANGKEPTIPSKGDSAADDDFYYGGRKTWQNVSEKVRNATLTGLDTSSSANVTDTDTVLSAVGKLQGKDAEYDSKVIIRNNAEPTNSTVGAIGQRYVNTSNGKWYVCVAIDGGNYTWEPYSGDSQIVKLCGGGAFSVPTEWGEGPWTLEVTEGDEGQDDTPMKAVDVIYDNKISGFQGDNVQDVLDKFPAIFTNLLNTVFSGNVPYGKEITESWTSLRSRIKTGDMSGLRIGDFKTITLTTGEIVIPEVAGIDQYHRCGHPEEIGHHVDFISRDCLAGTKLFNDTNTNNGTKAEPNPWRASKLFRTLNDEVTGVFATLPADLKSCIIEKVALLEIRYSEAGALEASTGWAWNNMGKLWLPTEVEVFGNTFWSDGDSGRISGGGCNLQYPIFYGGAKHIIKGVGNGGPRCTWWEASARRQSSSDVCVVDYDGTAVGPTAAYPGIYAPLCFRIG